MRRIVVFLPSSSAPLDDSNEFIRADKSVLAMNLGRYLKEFQIDQSYCLKKIKEHSHLHNS